MITTTNFLLKKPEPTDNADLVVFVGDNMNILDAELALRITTTDADTRYAASAHTHLWADITDKPTTFTPSVHTHAWADITNPPATYAPSAHTHAIADVTNLQSSLDAKVNKDITTGKVAVGDLPIATATDLGVVKIGSGLIVTAEGVLSATGGGGGGTFGNYEIQYNATLDTLDFVYSAV